MSTILTPERGLRWFCDMTKSLPSRFQRTRIWSPQSVMSWLMIITFPDRKTSYRGVLPLLEKYGKRAFGWAKRPSIASISKARRKMTTPMCREVLKTVVSQCHASMGRTKHRYGEGRFIAFDGTRLITRRSGDTARKLHRFHRPDGSRVHNPQALMVAAVDVFRRLPLDWIIVGKGVGERTGTMDLLETLSIGSGDVAIMDRGLPSRSLFGEILDRGADIVARMSTSDAVSWNELDPFLKSGKLSANITIKVGERGKLVPIHARIVERKRQCGRPRNGTKKERMVILTTLTKESGYTRLELIKIYGARWGIESLFGELKSFMDVEPFHTDFVSGVEQEIAASLIWMALASSMQAEAERTLDGRRVVRTDCLRASAELIGDILEGRPIDERMDRFISALRQYCYTPKPDRHAPRECKMPYGRSVQRGLR